jgi:hypothetical protein
MTLYKYLRVEESILSHYTRIEMLRLCIPKTDKSNHQAVPAHVASMRRQTTTKAANNTKQSQTSKDEHRLMAMAPA